MFEKLGTARKRSLRISEKDLLESIRQQIHEDSLEKVKEIIQERNGEVSVVKKSGKNSPSLILVHEKV